MLSAVKSVGFAPARSATTPVMTRPKMEASPEAPRMLAAAILATPWSMAWLTRWNSGPECAAQQQRFVKAMAQNGQTCRGWRPENAGTKVPPPNECPPDECPPQGECGGHLGAPADEALQEVDECPPSGFLSSNAQGITRTHASMESSIGLRKTARVNRVPMDIVMMTNAAASTTQP